MEENRVDFYIGRMRACLNYGGHSGYAILATVRNCFGYDHECGDISDDDYMSLWSFSFDIAAALIDMD